MKNKLKILAIIFPIWGLVGFTSPFGGWGAYAQSAIDDPCNAQDLPVGNLGCEPTIPYGYALATASTAYGNTYCNGSANRDAWYKFTVPANGEATVSISMHNNTYNMAVELYTSTSCNAGALTIANQNTQGFPCLYIQSSATDSRTFKNLPPNTTAYLRVYKLYDLNDHTGQLKICVSNTNQLADEPCNAGFFPVDAADLLGQACVPSKTFSWTNATLSPAIPNPSCGIINAADVRDVWFKVKVPDSGNLSINFNKNGGFITPFLALYNTSACNDSYTEIYCGYNGNNFTGLTPGTVLYGRFYMYSNSPINYGDIKLCASDFKVSPPTNNTEKVGIGLASPQAKLDVAGAAIFREKIYTVGDVDVRGNLIVQGNIISKFNANGGLNVGGNLSLDSLSFKSSLGNKISFYDNFGANNYGIGMQSGTMQIYAPTVNDAIALGRGNSTNFIPAMTIKGSGLVGIGIINPTGKLDVSGGAVWFRGTTNISHFNNGASEDTYLRGGKAGSKVFINDIVSPGPVYIGANVGLGNTIPDSPLSFANALGNKIALYSSGVNSQYGLGIQSGLLQIYTDASVADIAFGYGGSGSFTERMRIKGNGNVGIGTNNPTAKLSINAFGTTAISLFQGSYGHVGLGVYGGELRLQNDIPNGKVSFGVLQTDGSFTELAKASGDNQKFTVNGYINVGGTIYSSDERFKKNINPIQNSLDKILKMNGVSYEMRIDEFTQKGFKSGNQIGLLAQNIQKIVPEVVEEIEDGYLGIDYAKLVPLLIESIKELSAKIEVLENKLKK